MSDAIDTLLTIPPPSFQEQAHLIAAMRLKARRIASVAYDGYARALKLQEIETAFDAALARAAAQHGVVPLTAATRKVGVL